MDVAISRLAVGHDKFPAIRERDELLSAFAGVTRSLSKISVKHEGPLSANLLLAKTLVELGVSCLRGHF